MSAAQEGLLRLEPQTQTELSSRREAIWAKIGDLLLTLDDADGALRALHRALLTNPDNSFARSQAGAALARKGMFYDAIPHLDRVVQKPEDASLRHIRIGEVWSVLAHCYVMTNQLDKAYNAYSNALAKVSNPKDPSLWYGIGLLYDRCGSSENALEAFIAVLDIDPKFPRREEVLFCIALIYKEQGKLEDALSFFRQSISSGIAPPPISYADVLYQIAHTSELRKDYTLAMNTYQEALQYDPAHHRCLQQLGWLHHAIGRSREAIELLARAAEICTTDGQAFYLLGRVYMAVQEFRKAYNAYQEAVHRDQNNSTYWCSIGVLYYQMQQHSDALDAYARAIRLNPHVSESWYDLGTLFESCSQAADAMIAYRRASALSSNSAHILDRLGKLERQQPIAEPTMLQHPPAPGQDIGTSTPAVIPPRGHTPPKLPRILELFHQRVLPPEEEVLPPENYQTAPPRPTDTFRESIRQQAQAVQAQEYLPRAPLPSSYSVTPPSERARPTIGPAPTTVRAPVEHPAAQPTPADPEEVPKIAVVSPPDQAQYQPPATSSTVRMAEEAPSAAIPPGPAIDTREQVGGPSHVEPSRNQPLAVRTDQPLTARTAPPFPPAPVPQIKIANPPLDPISRVQGYPEDMLPKLPSLPPPPKKATSQNTPQLAESTDQEAPHPSLPQPVEVSKTHAVREEQPASNVFGEETGRETAQKANEPLNNSVQTQKVQEQPKVAESEAPIPTEKPDRAQEVEAASPTEKPSPEDTRETTRLRESANENGAGDQHISASDIRATASQEQVAAEVMSPDKKVSEATEATEAVPSDQPRTKQGLMEIEENEDTTPPIEKAAEDQKESLQKANGATKTGGALEEKETEGGLASAVSRSNETRANAGAEKMNNHPETEDESASEGEVAPTAMEKAESTDQGTAVEPKEPMGIEGGKSRSKVPDARLKDSTQSTAIATEERTDGKGETESEGEVDGLDTSAEKQTSTVPKSESASKPLSMKNRLLSEHGTSAETASNNERPSLVKREGLKLSVPLARLPPKIPTNTLAGMKKQGMSLGMGMGSPSIPVKRPSPTHSDSNSGESPKRPRPRTPTFRSKPQPKLSPGFPKLRSAPASTATPLLSRNSNAGDNSSFQEKKRLSDEDAKGERELQDTKRGVREPPKLPDPSSSANSMTSKADTEHQDHRSGYSNSTGKGRKMTEESGTSGRSPSPEKRRLQSTSKLESGRYDDNKPAERSAKLGSSLEVGNSVESVPGNTTGGQT